MLCLLLPLQYRGLFPKRRLLILTDKPRLLYADPVKETLMGEIPWTSKLKVDIKGEKQFHVITPNRTFVLEELIDTAETWKEKIHERMLVRYGDRWLAKH